MALSKIGSDGLVNDAVGPTQLDETANYAFTGTVTGAGGVNTPAFEAHLSSNQNISGSTNTKIQFATEIFDTDNAYDNSTNYRFTPQTAGKYFVYAQVNCSSGSNTDNNKMDVVNIFFKKNGSDAGISQRLSTYTQKVMERMVSCPSAIVTLNGSSDYVEAFAYISANTQATLITQSDIKAIFGAYKIIE